jgi:predicted phosphate transport protein (TIGR00153 family)
MLRKLLPRETSFFEYFDRLSVYIIEACDILKALASGNLDLKTASCRVREVEHAADGVTHECIEALHRTFITPFDRSDIHNLVKHLDDIVDLVEASIVRMDLYQVNSIRPETLELAELLVKASQTIQATLRGLRKLGKTSGIPALCVELHNIENQADVVHRTALARLFSENESRAIYVFKWKEILEYLERATDQCEDVANIVEGVLIEAS